MRVFVSLLLLLGIAVLVDQTAGSLTSVHDDPIVRTTLSVGLLMLGAFLAGLLFEKIYLPRISGYLVFGVVVGPFVLKLVDDAQLPQLRFISDMAVAMIALTAGGEIRFDWLKGQMKRVAGITLTELLSVWVVVGTVVYLLEPHLPFFVGKDGTIEVTTAQRFVLAALTGLVAASNSPAVVIAMINEFRATGKLAMTTLAVTIFKDMLMVVLFATALSVGKGLADPQTPMSGGFVLAVGVQLVGSLALGGLLGVFMALYVHRVNAHLGIFMIGSCLMFALLGGEHFHVAGHETHLEPLLIGLAAGMVMENLWPKQTEPFFHAMENMSLPVYCLFFALAGAKLDMGVLGTAWAAAVVGGLWLLRATAVCGSVTLAGKWTGFEPAHVKKLWLGFLPQAGIALALAKLIQDAFPDHFSVQVENILIGIIAMNELLGPIGFRWALLRSEKKV